MPSANAVAREAAWLATSGDGLPALRTANGGPFAIVQAYWTRTPAMKKPSIFVTRAHFKTKRFSNQRSMTTHEFHLKVMWPLTSGSGSEESDAQAFDNAMELLLNRICGFPLDHTHGGRFLSIAESAEYITVNFVDPEITIPQSGNFRATVMYSGDDPEFAN
jgi:hypothetical protein